MPDFRIFKDLKIAYYIISIMGAVILLLLFAMLRVEIFYVIFNPLAWIFLCAIFFEIVKNKRINAIAKELNDFCKAEEFLLFYNQISDHCKKQYDLVNINLALGYLYAGDFDKAYCMIKMVNLKEKKDVSSLTLSFSYYNILFSICCRLDKREEAEYALNSMKNVLEKPELKFPYNSALSSIYFQNSIAFDIKFKNVELNEAYYLRLIDAEATLICKVVMNYTLAEHYYKKGNIEQAKQHYNFVAQNGGSTYYTGLAEERLKSI